MIHIYETSPYPWPYDGHVDPATDHLVITGWDQYWMAVTSPTTEVLANIAQLANVVRNVVTIAHREPPRAMSPKHGDTVTGPPLDALPPLGGTSVVTDGIDGYYGSALDAILRRRGVERIFFAGLGLETTVHSTLRTANDMGLECLVVVDACAPLDVSMVDRSVSMIEMSGGIFGAVGTTDNVCKTLNSVSTLRQGEVQP